MNEEGTRMSHIILNSYMTGKRVAKEIGKELAERIEVKVLPVPVMATKVRRYNPYFAKDNVNTIIDEKGFGTLKEFLIKHTSSDYGVCVEVDGDKLYDTTWSKLNEITQEVEEIAAFNDGTYYVLHIKDIKFSNRLIVRVSLTGVTILPVMRTVNDIFYKMEVKA